MYPAAQMGAEVFYNAASKAGLGTDIATLNKIVDMVNQGMSPDAAANAIRASVGQQPAPQGQATPR